MKNRKTVVVAFLLVAAMLLGIGYAELSDTLSLDTRVTVDMKQANLNFDEKIVWSAASVTDATNKEASAANDTVGGVGTDDLNFNIHSLATKGDTVTLRGTIKNSSNVSVQVTVNSEEKGDNAELFTYEISYSRDNKEIPSNETMEVIIVVTVKDPIIKATSATFGITYTVEPVE